MRSIYHTICYECIDIGYIHRFKWLHNPWVDARNEFTVHFRDALKLVFIKNNLGENVIATESQIIKC